MNNKNSFKGQAAVALCAALWSTSGLFIKLLEWHPVVIAGSRSLVAALFMFTVGRVFRQRQSGLTRDLFHTVAAGLAYSATMLLFVIANKLTASANAILLQYSAPVWACLFAWILLKEKPSWQNWTALVLVLFGMVLFFKDGLASGSFLGNILAVLSGLCFGANSVFLRAQKDGNTADSMLLSHVFTGIFAVPFFFIFPPHLGLASIGAISFMGFFQIGAASLLFSYGIKRVAAVTAMLTASIEPVLNPLWVLIVTGEKPSLSALIGGVIILAAVLFSALTGTRRA